MALIEIKDFSYRYPVSDEFALKNISMEIEKGDFIGVIGHNGGGKTTLCNAIRGFAPAFYKGNSFGEILLDGQNLADIPLGELSVKIGYIFQNPFNQISYIKETVFDEICYGLENLGVPPSEIIQRVNRIIDELQIDYLRDKNPFEISGGQQQRVALASILVMEPDILVIDEPTSQLDPQGTEQVFDIINLVKQKGKTVILVEHKIELLAEYANKIAVMEDGELLCFGSTEQVLSRKELLDHGAQISVYAKIAYMLRDKGMKVEKIPVTKKQAMEQFGGLLKGREHHASY